MPTSGQAEELSVDEAAALLGVDDSTIRRWIKADYLKARQLPGLRARYRISRADVDALLNEPANGTDGG